MKKKYLILSVFAIVFTACETDLDVHAAWEEVTVVYGLLDAGDGKELQQIKISKAFLGEMDALQMAQYADSINFDPNDLDVKIFRIKNNEVIDSNTLSANTIIRDGDLFNDTIIIYTFENTDAFLHSNSEYELLIENKISGNVVSGHTELISGFDFTNVSKTLALYNNGEFFSKAITWNNATNGKIYQLDMVFEYKENEDTIKLIWSQDLMTSDGNAMSSLLEGSEFFNFLRNNITKNETNREFVNIDLIMTVGTTDLETYINVNQPITGIVQERPQFSNINNGLGLFSSRYTHTGSGWDLSNNTKQYITDQFDISFQ